MAQTTAERRAAQRRLAKELKEHKRILPESVTRRARESAAIGTSKPEDIRADLEERALRKAKSLFSQKINESAVEVRIKGGILITYGKNKGEQYIPLAKKIRPGVYETVDSYGVRTEHRTVGNITELSGMTNNQLRYARNISREDWIRLAKKAPGTSGYNPWWYK